MLLMSRHRPSCGEVVACEGRRCVRMRRMSLLPFHLVSPHGYLCREEGRERGREIGRKEGRKGGRGREGGKEGEREGGREGGRERGRERIVKPVRDKRLN